MELKKHRKLYLKLLKSKTLTDKKVKFRKISQLRLDILQKN